MEMKFVVLFALIGYQLTVAFPILHFYTFDTRLWLTGSGAASDKIFLDTEENFQGHGSLRIEHSLNRTSVYGGFRFSDVPGALQVKFNIKGLKEASCLLSLNFNKQGEGNGSAGASQHMLNLSQKWNAIEVFDTIPADAASMQFVFTFTGSPNTIWLNNLFFGYAQDKIVFQPSEGMALDIPLKDAKWSPEKIGTGFYELGSLAKQQTSTQIAFNEEGLFVAFNNEGGAAKATFAAASRDAALWVDDCDEFFLFNYAINKGWHFIVNANGALYDAILYQKQDGDPWKDDSQWNSPGVKAMTQKKEDNWESRLFIPWKDLNLTLAEGLTLGIGFARENKAINENSMWSAASGAFGDPKNFNTMFYSNGQLELTRNRKFEIIRYTIDRKAPKYAELLGNEPGHYFVTAWAQGAHVGDFPKALIEKTGKDAFNAWQLEMMRCWGEANMSGPALPWLPNYLKGGIDKMMELNKQYGMKFPYSLHSSWHDRMAREGGAKLCLQRDTKRVSPIDPVLKSFMLKDIEEIPMKAHYEKIKDKVAFLMGFDEPFNGYTEIYSRTLNPAAADELDEVDRKVKETCGYDKFGLPDYFAEEDKDDALRRIAFVRWVNREFHSMNKEFKEILARVFPGTPFKVGTNNTCGGLAPLDYALFNDIADILACDPYPTSTTGNFGFARALYHTGFSTKMLNDLAPKAKTLIMPQSFIYYGGKPIPSDLREWASQALKNGADGLMWYCSEATYKLFDCYKEMLAINALVSRMNRVMQPENVKTAVLFSNDDLAALKDNVQHASYSLYSILGEHAQCAFDFISNTGILNGDSNLKNYKLIYVPKLTWSEPALNEKLVDFVSGGGTLVVFDPRFLTWNRDGSSVAERASLTGVASIAPRHAEKELICNGVPLPLTPNANVQLPTGMKVESYDLNGVTAKVVGVYADKTPAVVENAVGQGKVIYFASQPFGNSELALQPEGWMAFFEAQASAIGDKSKLPIWDFTLPENILKRPDLSPLQ